MTTETTITSEPQRESKPAPTAAQQGTVNLVKASEPLGDKLRRLVVDAKHPRPILVAGWTITALTFLAVLGAAYLCWYLFPPQLWKWATLQWWHWLPAVFGFCFLFAIPTWVGWGAMSLTSFLADFSLSVADSALHKAQQAVRETEEEAIRRLEQTDGAGLLPLLKYSRAQLEAYYQIGLSQTRRGFFNSVLAMWLGFILLLVGVALYVVPMQQLGLKSPSQDFRILIMGGATIIEFISALFLWVYRSSTAELIHFYNTQMHIHTSILCFRIADTMEPAKSDDTKRAIVDKVLDWKSMPDNPPLVGSQGLRALLQPGMPKAA